MIPVTFMWLTRHYRLTPCGDRNHGVAVGALEAHILYADASRGLRQMGEQAALREQAANAADQSIRKLLRVLSDSKDERVPLRAEDGRTTGDR